MPGRFILRHYRLCEVLDSIATLCFFICFLNCFVELILSWTGGRFILQITEQWLLYPLMIGVSFPPIYLALWFLFHLIESLVFHIKYNKYRKALAEKENEKNKND